VWVNCVASATKRAGDMYSARQTSDEVEVKIHESAPENEEKCRPMSKVTNAYVSVELKSAKLRVLCGELKQTLAEQNIVSEDAAASIHITLAYGQGEIGMAGLKSALEAVARDGKFKDQAKGFEILRGQTTSFDYLVLTIDGGGDVDRAVSNVGSQFEMRGSAIRHFEGGFKTHVSLLKFPKGVLSDWDAHHLARELNASYGAAFALGQCICLEGECICAFSAASAVSVTNGAQKAAAESCLRIPLVGGTLAA